MKRSKRNSSNRLPEHYSDLDAPVYVWNKVHETGDLSWLLVKRSKVSDAIRTSLLAVWERIYDEFMQEFGLSESFVQIKQKELEVARLKLKLILTGDRTQETFVEIAQIELDEMKKGMTKADFMGSKIAIENKFKFQINVHTTSIREFYSYLKNIK